MCLAEPSSASGGGSVPGNPQPNLLLTAGLCLALGQGSRWLCPWVLQTPTLLGEVFFLMYKKNNLHTCLFLPDILSATAEKGFGAVVPMQLGAVEYNVAGTLAAFNPALLDWFPVLHSSL